MINFLKKLWNKIFLRKKKKNFKDEDKTNYPLW
jgi:hypothetical protein